MGIMKEIKLYDVVPYAGHEWFVIRIDGERISLLAKNNDFGVSIFDKETNDYRTSEIRRYLNTSVLNRLTENGAEILETNIPEFGLKDKVWLLSTDEAEQLPPEVRNLGKWWWLSSSGYISNYAAYVSWVGGVYTIGYKVNSNSGTVRPAITVKVNNLLKSLEPEPNLL